MRLSHFSPREKPSHVRQRVKTALRVMWLYVGAITVAFRHGFLAIQPNDA
jgi:hypothetical protein